MAASRRPKNELNFFVPEKIQLIFLPLQARRDAALDGLLNDAVAPTKYADLNYTVIADSPLLGFIQIDKKGLGTTIQKIQPISRDRLVFNGTD